MAEAIRSRSADDALLQVEVAVREFFEACLEEGDCDEESLRADVEDVVDAVMEEYVAAPGEDEDADAEDAADSDDADDVEDAEDAEDAEDEE